MPVVDLPVTFGTKPYSGSDDPDLPSNVRKMDPKRRRQWVHVFNSSLSLHSDEGRAFAEANSVAKKEANHTGVMLALYPQPAVAQKIAIPDGESAEDLHVTLLYFGSASDLSEASLYSINIAAEQVALNHAPLKAQLGGIGRFYTPDEDNNHAFYASVDCPDLPVLRQDLAIRTQSLYVNNHGFSPHMTLAYIKEGEKNPINSWSPIKVSFNFLHLMVAGIEKTFPFTGAANA